MTLTEEQKQAIKDEFDAFKEKMYAGKTTKERQKMSQFFTPPELSIRMIEKFDDLEGNILDPTCGSGNLLAAMIAAGADPKKCYGNELDHDMLELCRKRLPQIPYHNLHIGNALYKECYNFSEDYDAEKAMIEGEKRLAEEKKAAAKAKAKAKAAEKKKQLSIP